MKFSLTFWIADPDGMDNVKSDVMLSLWEVFKREGTVCLIRCASSYSGRGAAGRYHGRGLQLTAVRLATPSGSLALRAPIIKLDPSTHLPNETRSANELC